MTDLVRNEPNLVTKTARYFLLSGKDAKISIMLNLLVGN